MKETTAVRTDVRASSVGVSTRNLLLRFALTYAVPAFPRHILGSTQSEPDLASRDSIANGLLGREPSDVAKHEIPSEYPAVRFTELVGDGQPEFAQSHGSTLNDERPGFHRGVDAGTKPA